jgi:hypothetical protein
MEMLMSDTDSLMLDLPEKFLTDVRDDAKCLIMQFPDFYRFFRDFLLINLEIQHGVQHGRQFI